MNKMWKKIFILLSAYLSAIAFAVIGGILWYKKDEDEEIDKTLKLALIVTLIFTGISAFLGIYNYIGGLWSDYYLSNAYEFYKVMTNLVNIAKIITFATLIIKEFVGPSNNKIIIKQTKNTQNQSSENASRKTLLLDNKNNDNKDDEN